MAGKANWRVNGDLRARVKLRDAMTDNCSYQVYLENKWCEEKPQCVYYCTGQNILAGLSASASEIGLVVGIRARAWHSASEHNALKQQESVLLHCWSEALGAHFEKQ